VNAQVLVIAKEPVPGRCKTRLCPPCSEEEAAAVARAALFETLAVIAEVPAERRILVLDGRPGDWVPEGFDVVAQRGFGLDERLAAAFADCGTPSLLIGMDTPQITRGLLELGMRTMMTDAVDAVLGPTPDGGYWAIGFRHECPGAFEGVAMSTRTTAVAQRRRLEELGIRYEMLGPLRDIDYWPDALAVARSIPGSRLAHVVARIEDALDRASA
jgi:glycosyltransferase A (GT-A) superfamily protein (DUF2064 family)